MAKSSDSKRRIAWCISPVLSGVTTVYHVVGQGLRQLGWEVRGVAAGSQAAGKIDSRFTDEHLEVLVPGCADACRAAAEFVGWVRERKIDVVFCAEQMFALAAAPALPPHVKLVTRSGTITRRSYELATAQLWRTSRIVVETPRQKNDLIGSWKVPPEKCAVIPGGVEVQSFSSATVRDFGGPLRLVFLGRLDENQKSVMLLPQISRRLRESGVGFHWDIIGEGPEGEALRRAFGQAKLLDGVTFHGFVPRMQCLPTLQQAHLLVLPSRYEGHSWALLEAMACGCVPVASGIAGGTDFVVDHGENGILCAVGNVHSFSQEIAKLSGDREKVARLSAAATRTIRDRFSLKRVVRDHDTLFGSVMDEPPMVCSPTAPSEIGLPELAGAGWRQYVPQGVKNYVRNWAERFRLSI
jgi:glycosyltransferase involved in cell wall biosynthesis